MCWLKHMSKCNLGLQPLHVAASPLSPGDRCICLANPSRCLPSPCACSHCGGKLTTKPRSFLLSENSSVSCTPQVFLFLFKKIVQKHLIVKVIVQASFRAREQRSFTFSWLVETEHSFWEIFQIFPLVLHSSSRHLQIPALLLHPQPVMRQELEISIGFYGI